MKPRKKKQLRVAVISGGAGDIGRAIARRLHEEGIRVALGDTHAPTAVPGSTSDYRYHQVDVTDPAAVDHWLEEVERALGYPSIIIPNAAVVESGGLLKTELSSWRRTLDVNLTGAVVLAQLAARRLLAARELGRIIFIGSWAAHAPHAHLAAYCVAKAGLRMAMQCLALELAPHGILVNEVAPGQADAGLSRRIFAAIPGARERARKRVPLRSLMDADDVAQAVAYLCRPDTRQITGSVVLIDGGLSLVRPV